LKGIYELGKVFVEEAMQKTGINRTNLVGVIAHLMRTKQASSQADALKRLESGEFDGVDLEEQMIVSYQTVQPEVVEEEHDQLQTEDSVAT